MAECSLSTGTISPPPSPMTSPAPSTIWVVRSAALVPRRLGDYRTFGILLLNETTQELEMKLAVSYGKGAESKRMKLGEGLVGWAAQPTMDFDDRFGTPTPFWTKSFTASGEPWTMCTSVPAISSRRVPIFC